MLKNMLEKLPDLSEGKKIVSILSGGLDSTILTYLLVEKYGKDSVVALTFNYGQSHTIEINKAVITTEKLDIHHKIIDISFLSDIIEDVSSLSGSRKVSMPRIQDVLGDPQPPTYVPYRNMILASLGLSFAESNDASYITLGIQAVDDYSYWDTNIPFLEAMNSVSSLNRKNQIEILAPFVSVDKSFEIALANELDVPLIDTWSCYEGLILDGDSDLDDAKACGVCPTCADRIKSFMNAKVQDPVPYKIEINWPK
jgi:7-cyano-7-deazaguanine synthase